ncbi:MAG: IS630 family transposase [Nitrospirota bacterium]
METAGLAPAKKGATQCHYDIAFHDESGLSERPTVRRTWSLKGRTPIISSVFSWKNLSMIATLICTPLGRKTKLFFRIMAGTVKGKQIIGYLKELKRYRSKKKLLLIWDGLPAHRSKQVNKFLNNERSWLKVARLPAYAPDLNPVEYLWSAMKNKDLCNLVPEGIKSLKRAAKRSKQRIERHPTLLKSFLKASGLYER